LPPSYGTGAKKLYDWTCQSNLSFTPIEVTHKTPLISEPTGQAYQRGVIIGFSETGLPGLHLQLKTMMPLSAVP
jgi:hypothetical protein